MALLAMEPEGPPRGTLLALHAFSRSPRHLRGFARLFVERRARVLLPHLRAWWWPESTNNVGHLTKVADLVAEARSEGPVVVLGHSAGAPAGAWIAARLLDRGLPVTEVVFVDGVESPVRSLERSWPHLEHVRITAICGPPSRCNRGGALAAWLERAPHAADPPLEVEMLPDLGHGDIEGQGVGFYARFCGDDPNAPARGLLLERLAEAVERGLSAPAN